jgi:hypothetical protein
MRKTDRNFPGVEVIVRDRIDETDVFLGIGTYSARTDNVKAPEKRDYIFKATAADREYLKRVFDENYGEIKFSAADGNYELFYPCLKDGKKVVLYFSDQQRYGKIGK